MNSVEIIELDYFEDERGWLLKVLKQENIGKNNFGEIYLTTAFPGITKARHYHKYTTEWFCVIKGTGKLVLQDIESMERTEIVMGNAQFITVKIPSGIAHAIKNIGNETMYLLAVANQPYNPQQPDTYPYELNITD